MSERDILNMLIMVYGYLIVYKLQLQIKLKKIDLIRAKTEEKTKEKTGSKTGKKIGGRSYTQIRYYLDNRINICFRLRCNIEVENNSEKIKKYIYIDRPSNFWISNSDNKYGLYEGQGETRTHVFENSCMNN